jgi:class 3 adenylate cyclase
VLSCVLPGAKWERGLRSGPCPVTDKPVQRRLAAILVADVVGYTRLMEADETGTLAAQKDRRTGILEPVVKAHGGRIVKLMGDGVLTESSSVVNAVKAALELQEKFTSANERVEEDRRIVLRIGINLGDVIGASSGLAGARPERWRRLLLVCLHGISSSPTRAPQAFEASPRFYDSLDR